MVTAFLSEKRWALIASIMGFLTALYNYAILSIWVLLIFVYCITQRGDNYWVPYAIWAYSTILAPLAFMASKEPPDSVGTTLGLFFAMVSVIFLVVVWHLGFSLKSSIILIASLAALFALCTGVLVAAMTRANNCQKDR